ncbi:hypothetical protein Zmor_016325 [Zophobas morio]|uniref:Uncharacterized protein n=1 Tax=Zophobas morio TaxID=2755281 RepID=A0AA38HI95_9CUCU|nr:hypothetical protein Zmor_016325 [Zophobas morio]
MVTICTHSGRFHADEALACFLLKQLPRFKDAKIIRTRDPDVIESADIVVDVGAICDPERNRYDHHQRDFHETFTKKHQTKLSSAGLVYKYFGEEIIELFCNGISKEDLKTIYNVLYERFIEGIDGNDNGIKQYGDAIPLYQSNTDLPSRINFLNPEWNEEQDVNFDELFQKAMGLVGQELMCHLNFLLKSWLPARSIVIDALNNRFAVDQSGLIVELTRNCPWKSHLFNLEKELGLQEKELPLYVIYECDGSWRVQAIPLHEQSFTLRKGLPESWRGLRAEELSKVSGIPSCIFCHATGFVGGNKNKVGAFEMAKTSLKLPET